QFGMGPASGIVAILGLLLAIWLAFRRRAAEILLLSGLIPYFLTIVTLEAKWPRYLLPLVPYLCILAGALLARGWQWSAAARKFSVLNSQFSTQILEFRTQNLALAGSKLKTRARRWAFPALA